MNVENNLTVFVYGTLMHGFGNERVIDGFPHENYRAMIDHVELYDVGAFPAMIPGEHSYFGELVVFDEKVKKDQLYRAMDHLEGYYKDEPGASLYIRTPCKVRCDGVDVATEVYFWNRSTDGLKYIDPLEYKSYREYRMGIV